MCSCSTCLVWQGDREGLLCPSDWHQRPGRQRRACRASGQEPFFDKAEKMPETRECEQQQPPLNRRYMRDWLTNHPLVSGFLCMIHVHVSFACIRCNYPCGLTLMCLCVSVHVCQADQMLRCSLQGALISFVFTVTDGQQSDARPAAGQARMNGTAFKGQHPQGSRLTHLLHRYTQTYTCLYTNSFLSFSTSLCMQEVCL